MATSVLEKLLGHPGLGEVTLDSNASSSGTGAGAAFSGTDAEADRKRREAEAAALKRLTEGLAAVTGAPVDGTYRTDGTNGLGITGAAGASSDAFSSAAGTFRGLSGVELPAGYPRERRDLTPLEKELRASRVEHGLSPVGAIGGDPWEWLKTLKVAAPKNSLFTSLEERARLEAPQGTQAAQGVNGTNRTDGTNGTTVPGAEAAGDADQGTTLTTMIPLRAFQGGTAPKTGEGLRAALDALANVGTPGTSSYRPRGTGYMRVGAGQALPQGEMVLSEERDASGQRKIFQRTPGGDWQEAVVPGGTVTGGPVEGPARTIAAYNAGVVPAKFQEASDEAMRQADAVKEVRNRIAQERTMGMADLVAHQQKHEAFRFEHGVSAPDLNTPGKAGELSLPGGTARRRAEFAAWVERNDEAMVEERRGLEARVRMLNEVHGQAQRGYDNFLRHSDEVLRQGREASLAQYEHTVAAARHGSAAQRTADLAQTREERIARENADRADLAQTREERIAQENADRAARQDQVDAVNHAKALLDMADKDLLRFSEDYKKESKTGWTPALGEPDPRNPGVEDDVKQTWKKNPALLKQDEAAWARYTQLKGLAEQNDKRYQDLVLGWTPGRGGESGRGGPSGQGGPGGQIATYSKFPDIGAEAVKYSTMGVPDEQIRATVKKLEAKRVVK